MENIGKPAPPGPDELLEELLYPAMDAMRASDFASAEALFSQLIPTQTDPDIQATLYLRRGQCQLNLGHSGEAIGDFSECIRLDGLGRTDYEDSAASGMPVFDPAQEAFLGRGLAYMQIDTTKALSDLSSALRLDSKDYWALYGRAALRAVFNDREGALEDLRHAMAFSLERCDGEAYEKIRDQVSAIELGNTVRKIAGDIALGLAKRALSL